MKLPLAAMASFVLLQLPAHEASASDYGCRVLMCMSNPSGPMAVTECQPPIQRFLMEQAQKPPKPFPSCEESAPVTMTPARRPYDACPEGTAALAQDVKAIQLDPAVYANLVRATAARMESANDPYARRRIAMGEPDTKALKLPSGMPITILVGIGDGNEQSIGSGANKVCTAKPLGTSLFNTGTDSDPQFTQLNVYEQVTTMGQALSPRVLEIRDGDKLLRSQRY